MSNFDEMIFVQFLKKSSAKCNFKMRAYDSLIVHGDNYLMVYFLNKRVILASF